MNKILTVGSATQDIFIEYKEPQAQVLNTETSESYSYLLVAEGCKIEVTDLFYTTGGGAINSGASFKKLGFDVSSFFQLGADLQGKEILKELQEIGLDCHLSRITKKHKSGRSFILPSPTGNQPILAYRGANAFIEPKDLPLNELKQYNTLYITSLSGQSSDCLELLVQQAHKEGILVATNPGKSQLAQGALKIKPALEYISIFICNAIEATHLMDSLFQGASDTLVQENENMPHLFAKPLRSKKKSCSLSNFFHMMHSFGPKTVVVTNGAEGVYVSDGKKIYFQQSPKVNVISTVGAGDAYASTFVGSLLKQRSMQDSIQNGVINSCSVIQRLGPKCGLLTLEELEKERKKLILDDTREFAL